MITVSVHNEAMELVLIRIEPQEISEEMTRYTAEFVIQRTDGTGIYRRVFEQNTLHVRPLALVLAAIQSLDQAALEEKQDGS